MKHKEKSADLEPLVLGRLRKVSFQIGILR